MTVQLKTQILYTDSMPNRWLRSRVSRIAGFMYSNYTSRDDNEKSSDYVPYFISEVMHTLKRRPQIIKTIRYKLGTNVHHTWGNERKGGHLMTYILHTHMDSFARLCYLIETCKQLP